MRDPLRLINDTPHRARDVRAVLWDALPRALRTARVDDRGRALAVGWLTVRVRVVQDKFTRRRPHSRRGARYTEGVQDVSERGGVRRWYVEIVIGPASAYPQEHVPAGSDRADYEVRDWHEDLFLTAVHEFWHVGHARGGTERDAEAEARGRLRRARLRRVVGLAAW